MFYALTSQQPHKIIQTVLRQPVKQQKSTTWYTIKIWYLIILVYKYEIQFFPLKLIILEYFSYEVTYLN